MHTHTQRQMDNSKTHCLRTQLVDGQKYTNSNSAKFQTLVFKEQVIFLPLYETKRHSVLQKE